MKNKNQQIQYLNKCLQKKAELVRHKSQHNTSISLMSIEKSKQFRPKKGPIDLSFCVTQLDSSLLQKFRFLQMNCVCVISIMQDIFFSLSQKQNLGRGYQWQIKLEFLELIQFVNKRSTLKQGKKKLSQDDGGGCC